VESFFIGKLVLEGASGKAGDLGAALPENYGVHGLPMQRKGKRKMAKLPTLTNVGKRVT
jgi:hypothetical protein